MGTRRQGGVAHENPMRHKGAQGDGSIVSQQAERMKATGAVIARSASDEAIQGFGGIDRFRVVAAFLIVGIHTSPLLSFNEDIDFLVVRVFARIAVPFFLMATGFFLQSQSLSGEGSAGRIFAGRVPLTGFLKKTGALYAVATAIFLPVSIYAGYYSEGNTALNIFRNVVFDGTFYHLWYLPASILGVLLLYLLGRLFPLRAVLVISGLLYTAGLLGDSYYGAVSGAPFLNAVYDFGFSIFSYTRNGLFYAPIFLAMGAKLTDKALHEETAHISDSDFAHTGSSGIAQNQGKKRGNYYASLNAIGFSVSMALMMAEGWGLHVFGLQRHDSMYIMLVPCMFFLFRLTLAGKGNASPFLRSLSMWIYILHPFCLIMVRGAAKVSGLSALLTDNSLVHYIAVCLLSLVISAAVAGLWQKHRKAASLPAAALS